jgi:hypothetical protein
MLRSMTALCALITFPVSSQIFIYPPSRVNSDLDSNIRPKASAVKGTLSPRRAMVQACDSSAEPVLNTDCPSQSHIVSSPSSVNGATTWKSCGAPVASGAYRVIGRSSGPTVGVCDGLVAKDIGRVGVEIRGSNATLRNFRLVHSAIPNVKPHLPEGVHVISGTNIIIEDGYVAGFKSVNVGKYPNGDGLAVEKDVNGLIVRNLEVDGASDSAFDLLKGQNIRLDNISGRDARRCIKWAARNTHIGILNCSMITSNVIEAKGIKTPLVIDLFRYDWRGATKPVTLFLVHPNATLIINRCRITGQPVSGSRLSIVGSNATLRLGAGCKVL